MEVVGGSLLDEAEEQPKTGRGNSRRVLHNRI